MDRLVFFGPPGTGKTTALLDTLETLLEEGYRAQEIAVVSFTKKASREIIARAKMKFPELDAEAFRYWGTLHSICFNWAGMTKADVLGDDDWRAISNKVGLLLSGVREGDDGGLSYGNRDGDKYLFHHGLAEARMISGDEHVRTLSISSLQDIDRALFKYFTATYDKYKHSTGLSDFNDMLRAAQHRGPIKGVRIAIIDEAQDMSRLQWNTVNSIFSEVERMYVAGDDDQAIFEWAGADVKSFLDFASRARRVVLDHSWRVPPEIQKVANGIIQQIPRAERYQKEWSPADHSGRWIGMASYAKLLPMMLDGEWLVLARHHFLLRDFHSALMNAGIPHIYAGSPTVKQSDTDAIRTYEALRKGRSLDKGAVIALYKYLRTPQHVTRGYKTIPVDAPDTLSWDALVTCHGLKDELRMLPWYKVLAIDSQRAEMYRSILRHGQRLLDASDRVKLSTIHGAKGGEADNVVIFSGMSRRCADDSRKHPSPEHRVHYVATTRSRRNVYHVPPPMSAGRGMETYAYP
jgi:DNA helicase-2/ATP-dependent DNA helicase PcrA